MAEVRKSIVFNIDENLWKEFKKYVEDELGSYNGRVLAKMIKYILDHKDDFTKYFRNEKK